MCINMCTYIHVNTCKYIHKYTYIRTHMSKICIIITLHYTHRVCGVVEPPPLYPRGVRPYYQGVGPGVVPSARGVGMSW